ncbi:MAG TPA: T9SS type A sorting domain-containing protein [Chitinispirillaceae bacterium]|nr:T9SS type A sorting domain-containing protein [Chitinispirillaceae bacterium]
MVKSRLIVLIMRMGVALITVLTLSYGETIVISGTVQNKKTGSPVPGVLVTLEGTAISSSTDITGQFSLQGLTTSTVEPFANPWKQKAFWNGRAVAFNVPENSTVGIDVFSLSGRAVLSLRKSGLSRGQWQVPLSLSQGTYLCKVSINQTASSFKFQGQKSGLIAGQFSKVCDLYESPVPAVKTAKTLSNAYTLSFSKSRFVTNRMPVNGGTISNLSVGLDSIQFISGMTESQTRELLANVLGTDSIIFIKRYTLNNNHYYTEHINANWYPGGNICVLNLRTGAVRNVLSGNKFTKGVIKRFDLSYDAKKVLFDFKASHETGYRLYEADIASGEVRQITFPQANEDSLVKVYKGSNTQCGTNGLSCNVVYHHGTDDMEPCYLPDGGVAFVSTRCQIGIPCDGPDNFTTTNMYRVELDGTGMRPLSRSMASEFHPSMMPDGRIVYARWEYVDKASAAAKCIWSMNPDGSGSAEVYKNDINVPPSFVQPRYIPGSINKFVVLATAHCCYQGQYGTVIRLNMNKSIRTREPMEYITKEVDAPDHQVVSWPLNWGKGNIYRDPYPLAEDLFLVAHKPGSVSMDWWAKNGYGLYVLTDDNKTYQFYRDPDISCWLPVPFKTRPKEPVVNVPKDPDLAAGNQAVCMVNDIYFNMENVQRGAVKYLRVMEQVPRTWAAHRWWTGDDYGLAHAAVERNTHLGLQVQWGIVPVESDGSANFVVPANRAIFFHALDSNFQVVQHERTYVNYMPGERRGCVGCHETPDQATPIPSTVPIALKRQPSVPGPQPGDTTGKILLDYEARVQPIWDKHCISCHGASNPEADLNLTGTHSGIFSVSYDQLMNRRNWLLGFYIDEDPRNPVETSKYLPAYTMYSNCILLKMLGIPVTLRDISGAPSYLSKWSTQYGSKADLLTENHKTRVTLRREELIKVSNWIQSNLQYRGTYWGRFNASYKSLSDYRPKVTFEQATGTEKPN